MNYSPPWFLFCFSLKLDISIHLCATEVVSRLYGRQFLLFDLGSSLTNEKELGQPLRESCCGFHHTHLPVTIARTQAGPTQELGEVHSLSESRFQTMSLLRMCSDHLKALYKGIQLSQFGKVSWEVTIYLCAGYKGYFTGKLKHLLQNLKCWSILKKSTQEFIESKYISPFYFWKY